MTVVEKREKGKSPQTQSRPSKLLAEIIEFVAEITEGLDRRSIPDHDDPKNGQTQNQGHQKPVRIGVGGF